MYLEAMVNEAKFILSPAATTELSPGHDNHTDYHCVDTVSADLSFRLWQAFLGSQGSIHLACSLLGTS